MQLTKKGEKIMSNMMKEYGVRCALEGKLWHQIVAGLQLEPKNDDEFLALPPETQLNRIESYTEAKDNFLRCTKVLSESLLRKVPLNLDDNVVLSLTWEVGKK